MATVVPYVQRCLGSNPVGQGGAPKSTAHGDTLHSLLFHPIAGDSGSHRLDADPQPQPPLLSMKQLHFGLLDAEWALFF